MVIATAYTVHFHNHLTGRDETVVSAPVADPAALVTSIEDAGDVVYSVWQGDTCIIRTATVPSDLYDRLDMYV